MSHRYCHVCRSLHPTVYLSNCDILCMYVRVTLYYCTICICAMYVCTYSACTVHKCNSIVCVVLCSIWLHFNHHTDKAPRLIINLLSWYFSTCRRLRLIHLGYHWLLCSLLLVWVLCKCLWCILQIFPHNTSCQDHISTLLTLCQDIEGKGITCGSWNVQESTWQHVWLGEGCIGFQVMDLFIE